MGKSDSSNAFRDRFNISRWAIDYPWLTIGFWLAVTVAGLLAFSSLKYALFPDITFPVVVVNASAPLAAVLDTESQLTQPIEQELKSLPGLDEIRSTTYPGQTVVSLAFAVGTDLEESRQQVESEVKRLELPTSTAFQVIPLNLNESAVVSYAIESSQPLAEIVPIAQQQIVPAIAKLPGVLKVELLGVASATSPVAVRFNGQEALAIQVIKRGDANALEVVSQVEKTIEAQNFPEITLTQAATQADYIREATDATIEALGLAIVLSVLVIFPFLWNWRATLISALAIPTSLLGTFIVMAIFGFNLETITLLALALIVGIVVDDAIVDVENIARHLEAGESPRHAAITATSEIGLTVTAATLTIVAVFLPVGLMGGVIGQFFKPFGITVSAAVMVSLLVARTLSPLLAVRWLKPQSEQSSPPQLDSWNKFTQAYYRLLDWALRHRGWVISLAVLSLALGIGLIPFIPKGFIPKLDRGEFNIRYTAPLTIDPRQAAISRGNPPSSSPSNPSGSSPSNLPSNPPSNPLNDSLKVATELEAFVRKSPQVQTVFTIVGSRQGAPNQGTLYVKLKGDRTLPTAEVQDQFRQQIPKLAGVTTSIEDIQFVDTGDEKPLQITLQGSNLAALTQTAQAIKSRIQELPGLVEITATGDDTQQGSEPIAVEHLGTQRVAYVRANLSQESEIGDATDQAVAIAQTLLPPGVSIDLGGDSARISDIFGSFGVTLALSVGCILLVLFLLFRNWVDPLVIAFSLPLSLAGAMLAIWATGSPFGMISVIGIIFLLGLTNKSAILIVDYINQLRQGGMPRTEAILTAAPVRLRPILMTTAATILGMLPIALGWGAGAELRAPMAIAIIGGLVASTLLSLLVVPVIYAVLDDVPFLKRRFAR
ncbi:MAG: efflux RND transporter permease subunit [Drouetiella hepatica Uher 2000/2452]|jgi:multidrug efflux pump subunit AcrB|uniref:Efflux RND transporter permease subunit n=1 Tax=Drouetiella hepatica Uher 2000/2452 TaxID=904376 RepID=A0A951Q961_9CYAN|nr:efflux RND transporter permease subunit [Drouetiella hepatica Uher 2000/2452]